jgi:hypothetical protein
MGLRTMRRVIMRKWMSTGIQAGKRTKTMGAREKRRIKEVRILIVYSIEKQRRQRGTGGASSDSR